MRKLIFVLCFCLLLCGCAASGREYKDDITFQLHNKDDVLIIKEWTYLLGSGAEIYCKHKDDAPVFLGKISGADNGFCPFSEGLYEITEDGDSVCVSWCFRASDNDRSHWKSKTFEFPV